MFIINPFNIAIHSFSESFKAFQKEAVLLKEAIYSLKHPITRIKGGTRHLNQRQRRKLYRQVPQLLNKKRR